MTNADKIIKAMQEKGMTKIRIPKQTFNVEIRVDTDYSIDFNKVLLDTNQISIINNYFGVTLLKFNHHNITWVSNDDTERILKIIENNV